MKENWLDLFEETLKAYKTKNILILWGDDFAHNRADLTYDTLDKVIVSLYEEKRKQHTFKSSYSTIENYLDCVYQEAKDSEIEFLVET